MFKIKLFVLVFTLTAFANLDSKMVESMSHYFKCTKPDAEVYLMLPVCPLHTIIPDNCRTLRDSHRLLVRMHIVNVLYIAYTRARTPQSKMFFYNYFLKHKDLIFENDSHFVASSINAFDS